MADPHERAAELVAQAKAGKYGPDGEDWLALLARAHQRGQDAELLATELQQQLDALGREANAMAAVLADMLDALDRGTGQLTAEQFEQLIEPVPRDARRRVLAYRHKLQGYAFVRAGDQYGPLPKVPPRMSVLRERTRTIDADVVEVFEPGASVVPSPTPGPTPTAQGGPA